MERDQALAFMHDLLKLMVSKKAADLFITAGFPPAFKIDGKVIPQSNQTLTFQHTAELARAIMNDKQAAEFEASRECNFAISPGGIGRFRVNVFYQQGRIGAVLRRINTRIPTMDELELPQTLRNLAMVDRGLILVVGGTGSGKTTTLAAMIDHRNRNTQGHIVCLEDPIEYVHEHQQCVVTQREVGVDTESWHVALKNAMRQSPDVILMGEVRDRESMEFALHFAETGHLCMATLHATNSYQALDRVINFFPEERRQQLLMDLSLNLKGMISQRLVPRLGSKGRCAAVEILLNSPYIADLIFKGEVSSIKDAMARAREEGMQTFDQALFDLYEAGRINQDDALRFADSVNQVRLQIRLNSKDAKERDLTSGIKQLDIV